MLKKLLTDADNRGKLGREGRAAVAEKFNVGKTAEKLADIFMETVKDTGENNYA